MLLPLGFECYAERWSFRQFCPSKEWKLPINPSQQICHLSVSTWFRHFFPGWQILCKLKLWKKNYKYSQFSRGSLFSIAFEGHKKKKKKRKDNIGLEPEGGFAATSTEFPVWAKMQTVHCNCITAIIAIIYLGLSLSQHSTHEVCCLPVASWVWSGHS